MSKNEKLKAEMSAAPLTENLSAVNEEENGIMLTTDRSGETAPIANEETVEEIIEEINNEIESENLLEASAESKTEESEESVADKKDQEKLSEEKETEKTSDEESTAAHRVSAKGLGMMLTAGAVCVFTAGVVALMGLVNGGVKTSDEEVNKTSSLAGDAQTVDEDLPVSASMSWWMAGISENDIVDDEDTDTTTTTTTSTTQEESSAPDETTSETTTTTTAAETTTTTSETTTTTEATTTTAPVTTTTEPVTTTTAKKTEYTTEKIEEKVFYLTDNVNLRKGAGTGYTKITTLKKGTAVTATHQCSNGWYKVTVGDKTGYLIDDYLTTEKPVTTTTTTVTTTTKKPAETTAPAEKEEAPTTTADEPVISYTDEELEMFYYVVEGEAGGCSDKAKLAVANVIINRVQAKKFANTLKGVLTAKGQFTAINNYYNKYRTPTASTKDCVNRALYGEDNSNGAVYFYSPRYCSGSTAAWFESLTFCIEVDGQRFFK